MDRNQKSANTQHKSGVGTFGNKESAKHNTSPKTATENKRDSGSEKGKQDPNANAAMGKKSN